jgi:hypothetical protein
MLNVYEINHRSVLFSIDERRRFASTIDIPGSGLLVIGGESDSRTRDKSYKTFFGLTY